MASIMDLFDNNNAQDAANAQIASINQGKVDATGALNNGLNLATTSYLAGLQPFQTNLATDQAGQNAYSDATGVNGAAGNQRAVQNFQTGPGYQFQLDQGSANLARNKAATGQLASGSTDVDLQNLGQGMANQTWQQYISNLAPFLGQSTANASGIGGLYSGLAKTQNDNLTTQGNILYGGDTSQGNAQAAADLANNNAAGNMFNGLSSILGGASGLSGAASAGGAGIGAAAGPVISSLGSALLGFI
jgi:hypothetical protein